MITSTTVSFVLLLLWGVIYLLFRKKIFTSKLYFALLILMGSAGLFFHPLPLMGLYPETYKLGNIVLFAFLMIITVLPWMKIDKLFKRQPLIYIDDRRIGLIKTIIILLVVLSLYSIIYSFPYAIKASLIGSDSVRAMLLDSSIMPQSFFTTLAVGFASFSPVTVLMFYISLLDVRLKKYSLWLAVSSMAILVTNMASAGRDAFIFIPAIYLCLFFMFRFSLDKTTKRKLKRIGFVVFIFLALILGGITSDRFGHDRDESSGIVYGTWGYFYQQPYVFDHIIEQTHTFYGFSRRLKFLKGLVDIGGSEYSISMANKADYMFGTQYGDFYQIAGYKSLIIGTFLFFLLFYFILSHHFRQRNYFALFVSFCIYSLFTISGMFYFRYGGNTSEFFFYTLILVLTFFIPNGLKIKVSI